MIQRLDAERLANVLAAHHVLHTDNADEVRMLSMVIEAFLCQTGHGFNRGQCVQIQARFMRADMLIDMLQHLYVE
ncbi:hypothetical protein D3C85_1475290 [compost metagenome]